MFFDMLAAVDRLSGETTLVLLARWIHISAAAIVVGGVFYQRIVLQRGLSRMDHATRDQAMRDCRRAFKHVVHACIALLLLSGVYNSVRLFAQYRANPAILHGLWGLHLLLAGAVFGLSLWMLSGAEHPRRRWITINLALLLMVIAAASSLKTLREVFHSSPALANPRSPQ